MAMMFGRGLVDGQVPEARHPYPVATAKITLTSGAADAPDAERVLGALQPRLRYCYDASLGTQGRGAAEVKLRATIRADGKVSAAEVAALSGIASVFADCMARIVARASFAPPVSGKDATLEATITCAPSDED
jgi:hypothetical protein